MKQQGDKGDKAEREANQHHMGNRAKPAATVRGAGRETFEVLKFTADEN
jgi:hypothetical protein